MQFDLYKSWFKYILPLATFAILIYGTWAYCHKFCYDQLYKRLHRHATAIVFMCIECCLSLLIFLMWLQIILLQQPLKQPTVPPYMIFNDNTNSNNRVISTKPPLYYQCDPNGYPIWCTYCQSLKLERVHHSRQLGYCIFRFDHYCAWIGTVIGRNNYRLFIQYVFYYNLLLAWIWLSISAFIRSIVTFNEGEDRILNGNIIVIIILSCIFWLMTGALFVTHIYYMINNKTSLEVLASKHASKGRGMKIKSKLELIVNKTEGASAKDENTNISSNLDTHNKYLCYFNSNDRFRYVFGMTTPDFNQCWKKDTTRANLNEFLGKNIITWFIPWGSPIRKAGENQGIQDLEGCLAEESHRYGVQKIIGAYGEKLSEKTIENFQQQITEGNYVTRFQAYGDQISTQGEQPS
ncbi:palmitoyltransferase PFA5 NDAI_0H01890 [Naumovozyma dairenensis CBS 421]|uniref:Palmitoyltransferase n=1 Tax=Naumovozyma dairenensis (strain ATCC 10597 / BCRC 20456 / CBS 421 / NBRC 0211 / NRRL Y-12639) TaxID=1071378 RepID=G0WF02_NAUDC|nr:hypothetical protein NDAI_0H01890 [Naumovozyma dairenensis CBS 421]CCD26363.1 hypothetical protein NDAI_0H01890 [Naumovozyma dairenensis CBS 421]